MHSPRVLGGLLSARGYGENDGDHRAGAGWPEAAGAHSTKAAGASAQAPAASAKAQAAGAHSPGADSSSTYPARADSGAATDSAKASGGSEASNADAAGAFSAAIAALRPRRVHRAGLGYDGGPADSGCWHAWLRPIRRSWSETIGEVPQSRRGFQPREGRLTLFTYSRNPPHAPSRNPPHAPTARG